MRRRKKEVHDKKNEREMQEGKRKRRGIAKDKIQGETKKMERGTKRGGEEKGDERKKQRTKQEGS